MLAFMQKARMHSLYNIHHRKKKKAEQNVDPWWTGKLILPANLCL